LQQPEDFHSSDNNETYVSLHTQLEGQKAVAGARLGDEDGDGAVAFVKWVAVLSAEQSMQTA